MKRLLNLFVFALILSSSCKKSAEAVVDCFEESILTSVHITVDNSNPKLVHFEVKYSGQNTFSSVAWNYGDGASITTNNKTIDHTYATAGTYQVTAKVTTTHGTGSCEGSHNKTVTIN